MNNFKPKQITPSNINGQVLTTTGGTVDWIDVNTLVTGATGIYYGSGTIPTSTVATLTDTLKFSGGSVTIQGVGTGATTSFLVEDGDGTDLFGVKDDGQVSSKEGYWIDGVLVLHEPVYTENLAVGRNTPTALTNAAAGNTFVGVRAGQDSVGVRSITAIGRNALANNVNGLDCTAIGDGALVNSTQNFNTAIGVGAGQGLVTGVENLFIGTVAGSSITSGSGNILIGGRSNSKVSGNYNHSIAIGRSSTITSNNQLVIGNQGSGAHISEFVLGYGPENASGFNGDTTMRPTNVEVGVSNQSNNWNLVFAGGKGTGTGDGSDLVFKTAPAGVSGTTQNPLVTAMIIDGNGDIGIGTVVPSSKLHVNGSVRLSDLTTTPAAGYVLQSTDANGNTDWVDVNTLVSGGTDENGIYDGSGTIPTTTVATLTDTFTFSGGSVTVQGIGTGATTSFLVEDGDGTDLFSVKDDGQVSSKEGYWIDGSLFAHQPSNVSSNTMVGEGTPTALTIFTSSNTGIGYQAMLSSVNNIATTAIGSEALRNNTASYNTGVGANSFSNKVGGEYNTGLGLNCGSNITNGTGNLMLGANTGAKTSGVYGYSIAIGTDVKITGSNQLVIGSTSGIVNNAYFGRGISAQVAQLSSFNMHTTSVDAGIIDGSAAVSDFIINGARGTGTGTGGDIVFKTAPAGVSGSTQNPLVEAMRINDDGRVGIKSVSSINTTLTVGALAAGGNQRTLDLNGNFIVNANGAFTSGVIGGEANLGFAISYLGVANLTNTGVEFMRYGTSYATSSNRLISIRQEKRGLSSLAGRMVFFNGLGNEVIDISGSEQHTYFNTDGNFGIGITTPTSKLHVNGSTNLDGSLVLSGLTTTPSAGYVLQTDASGNADWANVNTLVSGGTDTFVSGMTFNTGTYDLTIDRNDGTSFTESLGILSGDMVVTGGTYDINTGIVEFTNNSGGTFNVSGFTSGMTDSYTSSAILSGDTLVFNNNIQGSNLYNVDLSGLKFTGNTSGTCISDLYVSNIHSCSPLLINPNDEGSVYIGSDSGFTYDTSNSRLGLGTSTPTTKLNVKGDGTGTTTSFLVEDSVGGDLFSIKDNGEVSSRDGYWIDGLRMFHKDGASASIYIGYLSGLNAPATGGFNIAMGNSTLSSMTPGLTGNVAIGDSVLRDLSSGGGRNTAIGGGAFATSISGTGNVGVGDSAGGSNLTGSENTFLGFLAGAGTTSSYNIFIGSRAGWTAIGQVAGVSKSIAIGYNAFTTQNNQMVVGQAGGGAHINEVVFGGGSEVASGFNYGFTLRPTNVATGITNQSNTGDFIMASGVGTGTGDGSDLVFKTAPAGVSGTTQNPLVTAMIIDGNGNVGIGTNAPSAKLHTVTDNYLYNGTTDVVKLSNNYGDWLSIKDGGGVDINNYVNNLGAKVGTQNLNTYFVDYVFASPKDSTSESGKEYLTLSPNNTNSSPFMRMGINTTNTSNGTLVEVNLDKFGPSQAAEPTVMEFIDSYGTHDIDLGGDTKIKTGLKSILTDSFKTTTTGEGVVRAGWFDAQGGDVNQAVYAANGDVVIANGDFNVSGNTNLDGSLTLSGLTTTPAAGYVLQSTDANGNTDWVDVNTLVTGGTGVSKFTLSTGFTASVPLTITHGLGTEDISLDIWENSPKKRTDGDVEIIDSNNIKVTMGTTAIFKVVVLG